MSSELLLNNALISAEMTNPSLKFANKINNKTGERIIKPVNPRIILLIGKRNLCNFTNVTDISWSTKKTKIHSPTKTSDALRLKIKMAIRTGNKK